MVAAAERVAENRETGERYVKEADVRSAVRGHEETVLRALGIDWHGGKGHIRCPYPDHGGENDWRWDDKKAQAHCTCNKAHSIFDVVMKCEGIEFDEAKIRVVEIIGRGDLVKTKGGASGKSFQKTDAAGLLNPTTARDDSLVTKYLAHRLGVTDPILPTTKSLGLASLAYYDPPRSKGGKPVEVGTFPCAVFEMAGPDGKRHAHRIYLAPNGAGKADLGEFNGQPRDSKKSARVVNPSDNTAGRCTVWGSAKTASWCIVAEGIETAAAIAYSFRPEIENGSLFVAAAITANGIEAFRPSSPDLRIVIAADRDEAIKAGRRKASLRGEEAARKLCVALADRNISIVLPGSPGQSIDWLDVMLTDGVNKVREQIEGAERFVPTVEEMDSWREHSERQAEIARTELMYPLPAVESMALSYGLNAAGKVRVIKTILEKDRVTGQQVERSVPISTPFGVVARLRFVDQSDTYGLRIVVQDMGGRPRYIDIDRGAFAKMHAAEIRTMLFGAGLRVEVDGEIVAVHALKAADPDNEIVLVRRPAWHELAGLDAPVFVAPSGEIIGLPEGHDLELSANTRMADDVSVGGTLKGWQDAVAAAVEAEGCQHWTLGIIAGFVGPLVSLTGLDTCGINLSGMSSSGKSTAQRLAASAWSTPDLRKPGLCQSARATDNAVEALASRANGTVLSLDELAHVPGKQAAKMIYTIAGGVGKRRMTADATIRDSYTWSTFALLSAESSLEEKITSDGGDWMAGMAVRIPDVTVTGINRNVPRQLMDRIGGIDRNYGHAGPAFVKAIVAAGLHKAPIQLRDQVTAKQRDIAGENADSATLRAAQPFALIALAGALAQSVGVLPKTMDVPGAVRWAWQRFCQSSDAMALAPDQQAIANLKTWIAQRWKSSIVSVGPVEFSGPNRETVGWFDGDAVYLPKAKLREAAGGAMTETAIAEALDRGGLLHRKKSPTHRYIAYVPKIGGVQVYALTRREFGHTGMEFEPHLRTVGGDDE